MVAPGLQLSERPNLEKFIKDGKLTMPYNFPFHKQPIKALYIIYQVILLLVVVPLWVLSYALPSWRPRRSWSISQAVGIRYLRRLSTIGQRIGVSGRTHQDYSVLQLSRIKDHTGFVLIPGAAPDLVVGSIKANADKAGVKPETIIGYWFGDELEKRPVQEGEVVVVNMHGGAYILGTAHPKDLTANIPKGLVRYGTQTGTINRVLSIEYRLSACHPFKPSCPFPTALLDALSGYTYLLAQGFKPQNILFSGDSAGGNLAIALTRYLIDSNLPSIPPPSGIILTSPWSDLSMQHYRPGGSSDTNSDSDYIGSSTLGNYALVGFIGPHNPREYLYNPYISPASPFLPKEVQPFDKRWPRTMIISGGAEVMLDEIKSLRHVMEAGGMEVKWLEVEDAVHDFFIAPGFSKHSKRAFEEIVQWVKEGLERK